jgi:Reverse transcriptase (RNA-dependent DNA polymerase)
MPFGLNNTPSIFQRFVSFVLKDYLRNGVEVYLDNILVHNRELKQHEILVKKVANTLKDQ